MMERPQRTLTRCLVCGFAEVRTDEVVERGVVLLAECPRCDHRWTERLEPRLVKRVGEHGRVERPAAEAA